jgi:hypothetical protein
MFEGMVKYIFKTVNGIDYNETVRRMSWDEAWIMAMTADIRYGAETGKSKRPSNQPDSD